jgi:hypothetical protein
MVPRRTVIWATRKGDKGREYSGKRTFEQGHKTAKRRLSQTYLLTNHKLSSPPRLTAQPTEEEHDLQERRIGSVGEHEGGAGSRDGQERTMI